MNTNQHTSRGRTTVAAIACIFAVAGALSTASCSTSNKPPTLTQVDATTGLQAHFTDAQQALHGQATFTDDGLLPPYQAVPCDDNDNRSDAPVNVTRRYVIVAVAPKTQVISTLHQYWLGQHWKDNDHDGSVPVGVTSPDGYRFYISDDLTGFTISGTAPCAAKTP